jgi:Cu(I)/Ag(I) efflux system membrane fusion protein
MILDLLSRFSFPVIILVMMLSGSIGCTNVDKVNQDQSGKQLSMNHKKVFVCSMHPQVIQDKPGDCSICGMSLIEKPEQANQQKKEIYVCSMHPDVIRNEPGDCPICGMSLIIKSAGEENGADMTLSDVVLPVNESVLASVQTVGVTREMLPVIIEASGIINFDTRRITTVSARYRGLIEKSYIKYKFQPVRKGQKIYEIYCPEIYSTHMNYVNLVKTLPDKPEITRDAMEWLVNLGLTKEQINDLIKSEKPDFHLSVYSNAEGFVLGTDFNPEADFTFGNEINNVSGPSASGNIGLGLNEGAVIEEGTPLFKVVSLESVRADLKIRTEDAGALKVGQNVILTDAVSPEKSMNARISQIEPLNGGLFQIVRTYVPNQDNRLYPGMKIQAHILTGSHNSLWVPKKAVIDLGQQQVVFLKQDKSFKARPVITGIRSGDKIEICSGIEYNTKIAANASLLTDSDGFINTGSR